jgi:type VI protein secretion system component VasF
MTDVSGTPSSPEELEAQIEEQREQLAETVDQLSRKLDVKAQARERLDRVTPSQVAAFVGAAFIVGALVWWRKSR